MLAGLTDVDDDWPGGEMMLAMAVHPADRALTSALGEARGEGDDTAKGI